MLLNAKLTISHCPHLEYTNSVWCPYKMGDIKEIKKVQKRATKLIINLKNMSYIDRLECLSYQH